MGTSPRSPDGLLNNDQEHGERLPCHLMKWMPKFHVSCASFILAEWLSWGDMFLRCMIKWEIISPPHLYLILSVALFHVTSRFFHETFAYLQGLDASDFIKNSETWRCTKDLAPAKPTWTIAKGWKGHLSGMALKSEEVIKCDNSMLDASIIVIQLQVMFQPNTYWFIFNMGNFKGLAK